MIVQLTGLQRRAILNWVDEQVYTEIVLGSTQRFEGTRWWWVEMPAIAWKRVMTELSPRLYGPLGGFRQPSMPLKRALAKVQTELSRLEHHPALTHGSVMGWVHEDIPAWPTEGVGPHTYSIYPTTGPFKILTPHHTRVRGFDITTWAPGLRREGARTHEESVHLAFNVGQTA